MSEAIPPAPVLAVRWPFFMWGAELEKALCWVDYEAARLYGLNGMERQGGEELSVPVGEL